MTGSSSFVLSLLMIVGFFMVGGGIYVLVDKKRYRAARWRAPLMIVCGLVMWANVAIMTWPI